MSGVLLETGNMSDTIVANIVIVSMIATPETEGYRQSTGIWSGKNSNKYGREILLLDSLFLSIF